MSVEPHPEAPIEPEPSRRKAPANKRIRPSAIFLGFLLVVIAGLALRFVVGERIPPEVVPQERVLVVGFDGMDSELTEQWMADGKLPNFVRLRALGGYSPLMSTNPSESPVSWSAMSTGTNPGKTSVYDFLRRHPESYDIDNAMVDTSDQAKFIGEVPVKPPNPKNYRQGDPLWKLVTQAGIRSYVLQAPVAFPPDKIPGGHLMSGLGVGDIRGTQGTYTYYTTDLKELRSPLTGEVTEFGGRVKQVFLEDDGSLKLYLVGPPNRIRNPGGTKPNVPVDVTLPMTLTPTDTPGALTLIIENQDGTQTTVDLKVGEWSDLIRADFELAKLVTLHGIFKVLLTHYEVGGPDTVPQVGFYVQPINLDPAQPPLPISYPPDFSVELVKEFGLFKTIGWPSETWALNEGVLDEEAYLADLDATQDQWEAMFLAKVAQDDWGFLFAVTQQTDHVAHMFWRFTDPGHPLYTPEGAAQYGDQILDAYQRADRLVGTLLDKHVDERTVLLVVSDHGFNSFRRSVNINRWLIEHGYMTLKGAPGAASQIENTAKLFAGNQFFEDVDWSKTQAYAMGLGQIYLNLKGRERDGIVAPGNEATQVKADIRTGLLALLDAERGDTQVVNEVFDGAKIYSGPPETMAQAPDLVMGFADGYRVSWQTSLGGAPAIVIEDNLQPWSGDHCSFDPAITKGILFANRPLMKADPSVLDVAPTVLQRFGLPLPATLDGTPVL